ncbi:hypothetical protein FRC11_014184, partial [Ceratobasidium sp. 423]
MRTTRLCYSSLPSLPRKLRVAESPYLVPHKPMAPFMPGRKAYSHLKLMVLGFKLTKARNRTTRGKATGTTTNGDEVHATSGKLALGHANSTQAHR